MGNYIDVIYTGGTIGMVASQDGYVPARHVFAKLRRSFGAAKTAGFELRFHEYETLIDSANAGPELWQRLVAQLRHLLPTSAGCIILHGTDTLAYTASAISFAFADSEVPIVFTGAQRPVGTPESDAEKNVERALGCVIGGGAGTLIAFGGLVAPANRSCKCSTDADLAFIAPNWKPSEGAGDGDRGRARQPADQRDSRIGSLLKQHPFRGYSDIDIPVITMVPGMKAKNLANCLSGSSAAVIRCFGAGTAPTADSGIEACLALASERGQTILAISQCLYGSVDLKKYQAGKKLLDAGVVDGRDMTVEAAVAKMHYLLGCNLEPGSIRELLPVSIAGELSMPGTGRE